MADYIAYLTNYISNGDEFAQVDGHQIRNLTRLSIDGFTIEIHQNPSIATLNSFEDLIGKQVATSELIFRSISEADFERIREITTMICELLSFALESRVGYSGYDFPSRGEMKQRIATLGTVEAFRPPFFWKNGSQIKHFIETCYNSYKNLRGPRTLNIAVDYLNQAALHTLAMEVKLAILFVLLEHLKHTFAQSSGYPFINGYFRNHGATSTHPGGKLSFLTLLTSMFTAVGMSAPTQPIISLRNDLIHSGLSALTTEQKWQKIEEVETMIREYLLRLLGYTGAFYPYDNSGARTI